MGREGLCQPQTSGETALAFAADILLQVVLCQILILQASQLQRFELQMQEGCLQVPAPLVAAQELTTIPQMHTLLLMLQDTITHTLLSPSY